MIGKRVFSFLVPGGLPLLAAVLLIQRPELSDWIAPVARLSPAIVFAIALFLGWRFERSRLIFAALVIGCGDWALRTLSIWGDWGSNAVFHAVSVLVPLNLALVASYRERGILTPHGVLRLGLIALQCGIVGLLLYFRQFEWLRYFERPLFGAAVGGGLELSQPALFAFIAAFITVLLLDWQRGSALENGFLWALATLFLSFVSTTPGALSAIYFATAILILAVAVLEVSYGMAFRDELTGLPGRRALNQALLKLGNRYTVAMLDVDHFKKFNDRYGHDAGDQVLRMVASHLLRVRGGGKPYRFGGEEFTVLFSGKRVEEALPYLEELREAIAGTEFVIRGWIRRGEQSRGTKRGGKANTRVRITLSIGAAERGDGNRDPQDVIKAADKALYRAKEAGRNRVAA